MGITINYLRLHDHGVPVDFLDVTGPYPRRQELYFEYELAPEESITLLQIEKNKELLYKSEWNNSQIMKENLFLGFNDKQMKLDLTQTGYGMFIFLIPTTRMGGIYKMTMKARTPSGAETSTTWVTDVEAFSNCTEMNFDEPFLNLETCNVGVHFYCSHPIYPLSRVTRHKIEWTSKDDPSFFIGDHLKLDEFETLRDGRTEFDFEAEYHITENSPPTVEMTFLFRQLESYPFIEHYEIFNTNISQCRNPSSSFAEPLQISKNHLPWVLVVFIIFKHNLLVYC